MCNGVSPTRNTPAYAGKTFPDDRRRRVLRKHPRLRGEDSKWTGALMMIPETPPLTRGRLSHLVATLFSVRNTPAYAGKTFLQRFVRAFCQKHPRLRGEDVTLTTLETGSTETPPLTRGRLKEIAMVEEVKGNTPAYAGKTQVLDY